MAKTRLHPKLFGAKAADRVGTICVRLRFRFGNWLRPWPGMTARAIEESEMNRRVFLAGAALVVGALVASDAALAAPSLPIPEKLLLNEEIENVWWYRCRRVWRRRWW
jgi:hypothetical protein